MKSFIIVFVLSAIFIRLLLEKSKFQNKNVMCVGLSFGFIAFFTVIQWIIDLLLYVIKLIF